MRVPIIVLALRGGNGQERKEQTRGVIESTAGMYGDLQGFSVGRAIQEIEGLQILLIESSTG